MNRIWLVTEENEYGKSVAMVCGNPDLAENVRALFQSYADPDREPNLETTFYGRYEVVERIVADATKEAPEAWYLSPRCKLPEGWKETLDS